MVRNDKYWGTKAKLKTLIFRPITRFDGTPAGTPVGRARRREPARAAGRPSVASSSSLKVLSRPAFNIGYVGMNQKIAPLNNFKVREAVAYGLDKKAVVGAFYGGRGPGGEPVPAAARRGVREEGRAGLLVQPGQGQGTAPGGRA